MALFIIFFLVLLFCFCLAGYNAYKAGKPCMVDTPAQAEARQAMNDKLNIK